MVAEGYKQTDVGVIPEDWSLKSFKEVFTFLTTATYSRADLTDNGDVQYLHYGDIHTKYDFSLDLSKHQLPFISNQQLRKYPLLKDGDIVMADASEDYSGICKSIEIKNITDKRAIAGLHTFLLRDRNDILTKGFKGYITSSYLLKSQFDRLATGMKVFGVSKGNLLTVQIPIPPKQEQQAIATALSDTDELINSLGRLIAKKEAIKTGAMQELLTGKKRLDGFSGEWEERLIKDFTDGTAGGTPSTKVPSFWGGNIRWMSSGELNDKIIFDVEGRITNEGLNSSSTKMIPKNCILIGLAGQGKTRGTVAINRVELCTNQSIAAIYPSNKYISEYLYYNMDSRYEELRAMSTGDGGRGGLNLTILRNFKVPFPSKEEQQAIATILSDIDSDIDALKAKLIKVKAIKEGMMQELLTGKTRLLRGATG